jgi:hypothetical protein
VVIALISVVVANPIERLDPLKIKLTKLFDKIVKKSNYVVEPENRQVVKQITTNKETPTMKPIASKTASIKTAETLLVVTAKQKSTTAIKPVVPNTILKSTATEKKSTPRNYGITTEKSSSISKSAIATKQITSSTTKLKSMVTMPTTIKIAAETKKTTITKSTTANAPH